MKRRKFLSVRKGVAVGCQCSRSPLLWNAYRQYLKDANVEHFRAEVTRYYTVGTLERLVYHDSLSIRRAAVLALGLVGTYASNDCLARALHDSDKTVAALAENAIRTVWTRYGTDEDRKNLQTLCDMVARKDLLMAVTFASLQMEKTPGFAEVLYQRGMAWFDLGRFDFALEDFQQALERNPHHFRAAAMMGYCYMEQGDTDKTLEAFRTALEISPGLRKTRSEVRKMEVRG
ncbi:MAG: tetratricopeptide repeat protein [Planctomycetia bacterium]|nr:tetratricopeptide repeat protein [Planctomycetia bacterium]